MSTKITNEEKWFNEIKETHEVSLLPDSLGNKRGIRIYEISEKGTIWNPYSGWGKKYYVWHNDKISEPYENAIYARWHRDDIVTGITKD